MNRGKKLKSLAVEYKVNFGNGKKNIQPKKKLAADSAKPTNKPVYITRLLALAHHLQDLIDQDLVHDYADIARLSGLTKARVSQIMSLTLLAPQIQEDILTGNPPAFLSLFRGNPFLKINPYGTGVRIGADFYQKQSNILIQIDYCMGCCKAVDWKNNPYVSGI